MCVLAYLFTPAFKLFFYSICHSDSKMIGFLNTTGYRMIHTSPASYKPKFLGQTKSCLSEARRSWDTDKLLI